ncbi:MAG: hypothetical protein WCY27_01600 [archaeon]|nr:hypothetical protein [archaeon]
MGNIMEESKKVEFVNLKKINVLDNSFSIKKNVNPVYDDKGSFKRSLEKFKVKDTKKVEDFKGFVDLKKVDNLDLEIKKQTVFKKQVDASKKNEIIETLNKDIKKDFSKVIKTNLQISKLEDKNEINIVNKNLNKRAVSKRDLKDKGKDRDEDKKKSNNLGIVIHDISVSNVEEKNINDLLLELENKTTKLEKDSDFIESFSFLDDVPSVKKISYKSYKSNNLFSKLDSVSKSNKEKGKESKNLEYGNFANISFEDSNFEELEIPNIIPLKDVSEGNYNNDEFISFEKDSKETQINEPVFLDSKDGLSLNSDLEKRTLQVDKLIVNKYKNKRNSQFGKDEIINKANEDDDVTKKVLSPDFIYKNNLNSGKDIQVPTNDVNLKRADFSNDNLDLKREKAYNQDLDSKREKAYNQDLDSKREKAYNQDLDSKRENELKTKNENFENLSKKYSKKMSKNQNQDTQKESKIEFLFPKDRNISKYILPDEKVFDSNLSKYDLNEKKYPSLVYSVDLEKFEHDKKNIFSKYNIDEFTYVTIYFKKEKNELLYSIVQPELSKDQSKEYLEIKKIFFNTIDKSYYYFNGDKYNVDQYISKIFDLTLDKLSYSLDSLKKKLYLKFIIREFSGLGFLTNLLLDKKILEISCAGEDSDISVYHIDYGVLNTNLKFNSIPELNHFVITLTKNMGLFINSTNPVINGYLPNGYKVEGLYSVGDTSSKGSSFVIKKYLDQPLTPISLIKTSIGVIDVFSYIWSAMSQGYKVVLSGNDDSYTIFNSITLFLPNKKIISVQAYDRLKLPQKEWVKKTFIGNDKITKKDLIEQTISQRPDYIIVDEFDNSMFDLAWYNLDLFTIDKKILPKLRSNLELINLNVIIIDLKKLKYGLKEGIQITDVHEYSDRKETKVIEFDEVNNSYHINLLSSQIDVVEFTKKKKMLRWMRDSKIYNYKDFNNICSQYILDKNKIIKRLGIEL